MDMNQGVEELTVIEELIKKGNSIGEWEEEEKKKKKSGGGGED